MVILRASCWLLHKEHGPDALLCALPCRAVVVSVVLFPWRGRVVLGTYLGVGRARKVPRGCQEWFGGTANGARSNGRGHRRVGNGAVSLPERLEQPCRAVPSGHTVPASCGAARSAEFRRRQRRRQRPQRGAGSRVVDVERPSRGPKRGHHRGVRMGYVRQAVRTR